VGLHYKATQFKCKCTEPPLSMLFNRPEVERRGLEVGVETDFGFV
jgi:hypothetical protein